MKHPLFSAVLIACAILLSACSAHTAANETGVWDCSVSCAKESSADAYIITYSENTVVSTTGSLSFQNRNDFTVVVHLLASGQQESTVEISAGGTGVLHQVSQNLTCTVGCHADVAENTPISLTVYDGNRSSVY